jgi:hypothetical protein
MSEDSDDHNALAQTSAGAEYKTRLDPEKFSSKLRIFLKTDDY